MVSLGYTAVVINQLWAIGLKLETLSTALSRQCRDNREFSTVDTLSLLCQQIWAHDQPKNGLNFSLKVVILTSFLKEMLRSGYMTVQQCQMVSTPTANKAGRRFV